METFLDTPKVIILYGCLLIVGIWVAYSINTVVESLKRIADKIDPPKKKE